MQLLIYQEILGLIIKKNMKSTISVNIKVFYTKKNLYMV